MNISKLSVEDLKENDKKTNFYSVRLINGMFFLILIISSNFVGDILNCKIQRNIMNNIYVKHLVAFLILYFLNSNLFTEKDHPADRLKNCIILYIIFIIIMRLNLIFTIIIICLLFTIHLIHEHYLYYRNNPEKVKDYNMVIKLHIFIRVISLLTLITAFIGLVINYYERKKEYGSNFRIKNFILGNLKCDNLDKKIHFK
tara:strand:- start:3961 stop:4560 length:600 start_codon:yes stop_codon:yes gene_type:complete